MPNGPSKLVVRWVTNEQARRYVEYDHIRPSWKHFVPELGQTRVGICFDMMTTSHWRTEQRIGLVIETKDIPESVRSYEFEGHKVYCLSERLPWEMDVVKRRELIQDAKKNSAQYSANPDELFVAGTIDSLGKRLSGVVLLDTGRKMGSKVEAEVREFCAKHQVSVLDITPDEFSDLRSVPGRLRESLGPRAKHAATSHTDVPTWFDEGTLVEDAHALSPDVEFIFDGDFMDEEGVEQGDLVWKKCSVPVSVFGPNFPATLSEYMKALPYSESAQELKRLNDVRNWVRQCGGIEPALELCPILAKIDDSNPWLMDGFHRLGIAMYEYGVKEVNVLCADMDASRENHRERGCEVEYHVIAG